MFTLRVNNRRIACGIVAAVLWYGLQLHQGGSLCAGEAETAAKAAAPAAAQAPSIGLVGPVGCLANPRQLNVMRITTPGVYENLLVDGNWAAQQLVQILADNVTLRNCEIRNGMHNGVLVESNNVTIESCRIHHLLKGTFKNQQDAHGITGGPKKLLIHNCEIYQVSGDAVQFDPDRGLWDEVVIDHCTFWTGPLTEKAAGFNAGERPGENAVDTKQIKSHGRSRLTIRNCYFYGYGKGQIVDQSALNLKENVTVTIVNCVLKDNDIALRLRGNTGKYPGALVNVSNTAVYNSAVAVRMEDGIQNLKITNLGIGSGVVRKYVIAKGIGSGYVNTGEFLPGPIDQVLLNGVHPPASAKK